MASGSVDLGASAENSNSSTTPSGAAGGDLGGNYPNPTVLGVGNVNSGLLPVANIASLSFTNVSGSLALSRTTGSLSLTDRVSGTLSLSQTSGSISLTNQVVNNLPLSQTSGSVSLTAQVSGVLPAPQVGIIDVASGTSGSVSLTNKVSGTLPASRGGTGTSAFAQGSVVFVDGSGVYAENNARLFWDNTNIGLGIGTSSVTAGAKLDVVGSGTISSIIVPRGTTAERPLAGTSGMMRYNTSNSATEFYSSSTWGSISKVVGAATLASLSANIGSTTLVVAPSNIYYRATATIWASRAASGASSVLPNIVFAITSATTNNTFPVSVAGAVATPPIDTHSSGILIFYARAGSLVNYFTTNYSSSGSISLQYGAKIILEEMPFP